MPAPTRVIGGPRGTPPPNPDPTPHPTPQPPPIPVSHNAELPTLIYVSSTGAQFNLTDTGGGITALSGPTGLGTIPFTVSTDPAAARAGSILGGVTANEREIFIPLFIDSTSRAGLRAKLRALSSALDPRDGDGELFVLFPEGGGRRIACRYKSGLEGSEADGDAWMHEVKVPLVLLAVDPAPRDLAPITQSFNAAAPVGFFPLKLPLKLSSSSVLGDVTITNPGDEDSYPVWIITGPFSTAELSNVTTGETFQIADNMILGQSVTINCDPDFLSVVANDTSNWWPMLSPDPRLWALRPGANEVALNLSGATTGSSVTLTYTPRYKTFW